MYVLNYEKIESMYKNGFTYKEIWSNSGMNMSYKTFTRDICRHRKNGHKTLHRRKMVEIRNTTMIPTHLVYLDVDTLICEGIYICEETTGQLKVSPLYS